MSVEKSNIYKGEAARKLFRKLNDDEINTKFFLGLLNYHLDPIKGHDGGNARDLFLAGDHTRIAVERISGYDSELSGLVNHFSEKEGVGGIEACSRFVGLMTKHKLRLKSQVVDLRRECGEFLRGGVTVMLQGSYGSRRKTDGDDISKRFTDDDTVWNACSNADGMERLMYLNKEASYKRDLHRADIQDLPIPGIKLHRVFELPKRKRIKLPFVSIRICAGFLLVELDEKVLVLTSKDRARVKNLFESHADCIIYCKYYTHPDIDYDKQLWDGYQWWWKELNEKFLTLHHEDLNWITRSLDVVQFKFLAYLAGPFARDSLELQTKKIMDEHLDKYFDLRTMFTILKKMNPGHGYEMCKFYKMLWVPDYDPMAVMSTQEESHAVQNEMADYKESKEVESDGVNMDVTYEDFLLYRRWNFLANYYDTYGVCPGTCTNPDMKWAAKYPAVRPSMVKYKETVWVDLRGSMPWADYEGQEIALVKDKSTIPENPKYAKTPELWGTAPDADRNYLLWFLRKNDGKNLKDYRDLVLGDKMQFEPYHTVAPKPEAKKPLSRATYLASPKWRMVLSEMEEQVARRLRKKRGNMSGLPEKVAAEKMVRLGQLGPQIGEFVSIALSFDLKKFSPKKPARVTKDQLDFLSEIHGKDHIKGIYKLIDKAKVVCNQAGLHYEYQLCGTDLEGYFGRMNTDWHIDLMAYALRVCKSKGYIRADRLSELGVLIDDGALRVDIEQDKLNEYVPKIKEVIEKVYNMAGMAISWDKTFVSDRLVQFLDTVMYKRRILHTGIKSFLKIGRKEVVLVDSIPDRINALQSYSSSAIKAGANMYPVMIKYLFEIFRVMARMTDFDRNFDWKGKAVWMAATPIALGGLGMCNCNQLGANLSENPLTAGIGTLARLAKNDATGGNAAVVNRIINQPKIAMTNSALVNTPRTIRIVGATFKQMRAKNLVSKKLRNYVVNPEIRPLLYEDDGKAIDEFVDAIRLIGKTNALSLDFAVKSSPTGLRRSILAKFQRSTTLLKLATRREVMRIRKANQSDGPKVAGGFLRVNEEVKAGVR